MVMEAHSGKVLLAANSTVKRPVASLTKIATGAVAVDWAVATDSDPGKVMLSVPPTVAMVGGANPLDLQPGDRISLRDALYSALLLERPGAKAFSTAADMARLSIHAMRRNAFNFIVRQPDRQIVVHSAVGGTRNYRVRNSNELIGQPGILGIKTGTTAAAGPCLAVCMDREPLVRMKPDGTKGATPRRLIVVLLNSPDRFTRASGLIHQGWAVYDPWLAAGAPVIDRRREIITVPEPG